MNVKIDFKEENQKLEIEFIDLNDFYVNKDDITDKELENFIKDNKDELKIEYLDFSYTIINPKNLIGVDDFNQSFFDKIDEIEVAISNEIDFKTITSNFDLKSVDISNFRFSTDKNEIEKKIYELRNNKFDIFENKNDYILYNIKNITQKSPDLSDKQIKEEVLELVFQKNKFDYNQKLLNEITNKKFNDNNFLEMGKDKIQAINLNSVRDNKKFDINAVEVLYSLPEKSFTLINDDKNNIYLVETKADILFSYGYGMKLNQNNRFGIRANLVYNQLYTDESTGYNFDFGYSYDPNDNLSIGFAINNLGSEKTKNKSLNYPVEAGIGISYQIKNINSTFHSDIVYHESLKEDIALRLSSSTKILNFHFITGLYKIKDKAEFSCGVSFKYRKLWPELHR